MTKVIKIEKDNIYFEDGSILTHQHDSDCCESHYLDLSNIELSDFDDLEFDLSDENFFNRITDYGIELVPVKGHSVKIPGYGYNNGYYSSNLNLELTLPDGIRKEFDISECQDINWG